MIAGILWGAALLLTAFFVFSGWWLVLPFVFVAGSGGQVLGLLLAIGVLGTTAHVVGRQR